ncbi:hypothetical protein WEB32_30320 [Streptomyces netropsis]|uniref:hypothetical protein n=1 Tax=Streptomyces netropsis TaxID=55404 RepID=UPI0030D5115E
MSQRADLAAFATALAERLPGTWTSQHRPHATYPDQFSIAEDLRDMGHAQWAVSEFVLNHDAVLNGPDGMRLYVIDRPLNQHEFIVAALAPPGLESRLFHGVQEPNGITVGTDPVRAAATVARRLLPRYEEALAHVRHRAAQEQAAATRRAARVSFAWQADGTLTATTEHPGAIEHLERSGFGPDPREPDTFALPSTLAVTERDERLRTVALQLGGLGADVSIGHAPTPRVEAPAPVPTVVSLAELAHQAAAASDLHEVAAVLDRTLHPTTGALPALEGVLRQAAARAADTGPPVLRGEFTSSFNAITTRLQHLTRDLAELRVGLGEIAVLTRTHGAHIWTDLLGHQHHTTRTGPTATTTSVPAKAHAYAHGHPARARVTPRRSPAAPAATATRPR